VSSKASISLTTETGKGVKRSPSPIEKQRQARMLRETIMFRRRLAFIEGKIIADDLGTLESKTTFAP
jgi:hypothetical protein